MNNCLKTDMYFLDFYGISQYSDKGKKRYVIVMKYAEGGDLRKYLSFNFVNNSWKNRIDKLWGLAIDMRTLHWSKLVHRDLHGGNVLLGEDRRSFIADFGLACEDGQAQENGPKGVLPYVAPEILFCKPYTKATDVYSFGIIMWEWTSYQPPFCDVAYDAELALQILDGLRPSIIKDTPECYVQLMQQCWDRDSTKRPTAQILAETLKNWHHILANESEPTPDNDNIRKQFELAEQRRQKNPSQIKPNYENTHPMAVLTSRLLPTFSLSSFLTEENSRKLNSTLMIF
jgi:serine/threonine protein kinase